MQPLALAQVAGGLARSGRKSRRSSPGAPKAAPHVGPGGAWRRRWRSARRPFFWGLPGELPESLRSSRTTPSPPCVESAPREQRDSALLDDAHGKFALERLDGVVQVLLMATCTAVWGRRRARRRPARRESLNRKIIRLRR